MIVKEYELKPQNGRKSFYGKAKVNIDERGNETLYSYDTAIITRDKNGILSPIYTGRKYGSTTATHVKSFCGLSKDEYRRLLKRFGMKFDAE